MNCNLYSHLLSSLSAEYTLQSLTICTHSTIPLPAYPLQSGKLSVYLMCQRLRRALIVGWLVCGLLRSAAAINKRKLIEFALQLTLTAKYFYFSPSHSSNVLRNFSSTFLTTYASRLFLASSDSASAEGV